MAPTPCAASYRIRRATLADIAVVTHHRVAMFRDMGILPPADEPAFSAASRTYLAAVLASGEYVGWLVESSASAGAAIAAGGGLMAFPTLPRPVSVGGDREVYILNVYTEPAHRRYGLARRLMTTMLAWCDERGVRRISLHASDEGRPLYESLGFTSTNEMRLVR